MGNAPPISEKKLKELRLKYDKDDNGLSWEEFRELAVEVGELQGLSKPVSDEKLRKIFEGLDADKSGIVSIQEFEAAYAKLEEQLQAAAKAKAKAKANAKGKAKAESKAKAEGKAKGKPKAKPKAAADAEASGEAVADVSIFDALPGFGSFVPELPTAESLVPELPDLGVGAAMAAAFAEDTTVKAQAIPTPKKIKAPPLPEPAPPALSTHVPWSTQLKAADPDWYDEDDAGFTSDDDFPDVGEVPEESKEELPSAAPKVPPRPKAPTPKPAVAKPKAPKARSTSPKAKAKGLPKPQVKPKVEPKGRAQGISAADGVTEDVFSSPIHRREAVAHPAKQADPHPVRVLQTAGGMDLVQQDPEVLSEPESQESVDSISGEIARSWDPGAKDARYSYARDRAVGFSEFWQPLKWSEEEWERRLLASGNLRRKVGIAKHTPKATMEENPKDKAAPVPEDHQEVEELIAPEKPKPRSQYPLATEVKPKFIDVPLSGLQGVAADGAVSALRKNAKTPAAPVFGDPLDDELYGAGLPLPTPGRPGEPLVPLAAVAPAHLRERAPETPPDTPADAPRFGYPGWQPPAAVFSDSNRTLLRPMMQEVQPRHRQVEGREQGPGDYGDQPGRTWL